mmetsp:Transcript_19009/g.42020  ORF Transcript_19009/g.42020 Transcript_19009/m.42020 type:complete len:361 (+) Transcript_19009:1315-2397(+)
MYAQRPLLGRPRNPTHTPLSGDHPAPQLYETSPSHCRATQARRATRQLHISQSWNIAMHLHLELAGHRHDAGEPLAVLRPTDEHAADIHEGLTGGVGPAQPEVTGLGYAELAESPSATLPAARVKWIGKQASHCRDVGAICGDHDTLVFSPVHAIDHHGRLTIPRNLATCILGPLRSGGDDVEQMRSIEHQPIRSGGGLGEDELVHARVVGGGIDGRWRLLHGAQSRHTHHLKQTRAGRSHPSRVVHHLVLNPITPARELRTELLLRLQPLHLSHNFALLLRLGLVVPRGALPLLGHRKIFLHQLRHAVHRTVRPPSCDPTRNAHLTLRHHARIWALQGDDPEERPRRLRRDGPAHIDGS